MLPGSTRKAIPFPLRHLSICSIDRAIQYHCQEGDIEDALHLLSSEEAPPASYLSYLSLLKVCNSTKNLVHVRCIQRNLALHSLHVSDALGNPLVVSLARCGALHEAVALFYNLTSRTVYSWTAIIAAHTDCGRALDALRIYSEMLNDCVQPDQYTYVSLFKACGICCDLKEGMILHADAHKKGLTSNAFAGSSLLSMYGKCQYIAEAEQVFSEINEIDNISWIAMLSSYVETGHAKKALLLYRQMHEDFPTSNQLSMVLALQACGCMEEDKDLRFLPLQSVKEAAFDIGQALHSEGRQKRLTSDAFVGSALVNMYGKCGSLAHFENVFVGFPDHDLAFLNSMLSAYVQQGHGFAALLLFSHMHKKGMVAGKSTLIIALQACAIFAEEEEEEAGEFCDDNEKSTQVVLLHLVHAFHKDIVVSGLTSDVFVGSALISLYGKCRNSLEAEYTFGALAHHNVVACSAIMLAFLEQGEENKVLKLFRQMQEERVILDQHIFVLGIRACIMNLEKSINSIHNSSQCLMTDIGRGIHSAIRIFGYIGNVHICSALVNLYSGVSSIAEVENVFTTSDMHNVVSWMALLTAYARQGDIIRVLQLYHCMLKEGVAPDGVVFALAFQVCVMLNEREVEAEEGNSKHLALEIGRALHADCKMFGLASDIQVVRSLLSLYSKCGAITCAEDSFDVLFPENAFVCGSMIIVLIENSFSDQALELYRHVSGDNFLIDARLLSCVLRACSDTGDLMICRKVHFGVISTGLYSCLYLSNTLIHAYGSCASMMDGQEVLMAMLQPDIVTWNACIAGFAQEGCMASLEAFSSLQAEGKKPGSATFLSVLTFCCHFGMLDEGFQYYFYLTEDSGVVAVLKHTFVMMDLLGRVGNFHRLEGFLYRNSLMDSVSLWMLFLIACCRHGHVELGECAFNRIVSLQPDETAAYVLMANAFNE